MEGVGLDLESPKDESSISTVSSAALIGESEWGRWKTVF